MDWDETKLDNLGWLSSQTEGMLRKILRKKFQFSLRQLMRKKKSELIEMVCDARDKEKEKNKRDDCDDCKCDSGGSVGNCSGSGGYGGCGGSCTHLSTGNNTITGQVYIGDSAAFKKAKLKIGDAIVVRYNLHSISPQPNILYGNFAGALLIHCNIVGLQVDLHGKIVKYHWHEIQDAWLL